MGKIVFAAAMSHAPHITAFPERANSTARERVYAAMRTAGEELAAARPDVLVMVSSDHFTNLFHDRMPAFCIGTGESYRGPVEDWIQLPSVVVPGHSGFAHSLLGEAFADNFEPAFSGGLLLEHGSSVPLAFLTPTMDLPIVSVLQNCMVPPLPRLRRCFEFGRLIRRAAERSNLRVAVVGTGGLSHSPGAPEAGVIDQDFDRDFLARLASDKPLSVLDIENARIDRAGFGTWEIRQWITALGASGGTRADVLAYEPIEAWETGCGVITFPAE